MLPKMDDGEIDVSDHGMLQNLVAGEPFVDELLKNTQTCTHTHTCNPPGPDSAAHTHTCFHTHTQVLTSEDDAHQSNKKHPNLKPRRPSGNREAVRKYREKKKAHTAYLEEEVKKVHLLNQQLVKKLQGQAALEAEVVRLRSVLINLRGKIDAELGLFPLQKQCALREGESAAAIELQCQADLPCLHPHTGSSSQSSVGKVTVPWDGKCQTAVIECPSTINDDKLRAEALHVDTVDTLVSSASKPQ